MKILFEKNLTPTVFILTNNRGEKFCGSCGIQLTTDAKRCPRCGMSLHDSWRGQKKELFATRITISESGDKLFMNVFKNKVWLHQNKFRFSKYIFPFVFNFKTGQSYKLPVLNGDTKQALRVKNNGIKNISYCRSLLFEAISGMRNEEVALIKIFINKARQYLTYKDEFDKLENRTRILSAEQYNLSLEEYLSSNYNISESILSLVKYKHVSIKTISAFMCYYEELKNIRKYWLKPNFRKNVEKTLKLKFCEEAWEKINEALYYLYDILPLGRLKVDNQNKIINISKSLFDSRFESSYHYCASALAKFVNLFENENVGTNRILKLVKDGNKIPTYQISDTTKMLVTVKESGANIKTILRLKSFDEIHDRAMAEYKKLKLMNRKINLTEEQKKLNYSIDDVEFKVCTETDELQHIGDTMHHCVASYADDAVAKRCTIIGATKNNRLFACIEVRNGNILQSKSYCNQKLSKEDLVIVRSWANKKGLRYDNCRDLM